MSPHETCLCGLKSLGLQRRITYHTRQDMLSEGGVLLLQEMFLSYDLD